MEIIDVIDSAVKIGLGALISGIATYTVTKANHKNDLEKEYRLQKIKKHEEIKNGLAAFISNLRDYQLTLLGYKEHKEKNLDITNDAQAHLAKKNHEIFLACVKVCETRISLIELKEFESAETLNKIIGLIGEIRNPIHLSQGKTIPTQDEVKKFVEKTYQLEQLLLNNISTYFENAYKPRELCYSKILTYFKQFL